MQDLNFDFVYFIKIQIKKDIQIHNGSKYVQIPDNEVHSYYCY